MPKYSKLLLWVFGALIFLPGAAVAGQHSLDDLSWLSGHWIDTRDPEKPIEVRWNTASGDAMIGTWRKNDEAGLAFYEMLTMREVDGEVFYRFDFYKRETGETTFSQSSSTQLKLLDAQKKTRSFSNRRRRKLAPHNECRRRRPQRLDGRHQQT